MAKRNNKKKDESAHEDYDLPAELDFRKLKFVGVGLDVLEKHIARKAMTVHLDPDVAQGFQDERAVNDALRLVLRLRDVPSGIKRRKSA